MRNLEIVRRQKAPHFPDLTHSAVCLCEDSHLLICDKKTGILSCVTTDMKEDHAQVLCDQEALKDVVQMQYVRPSGLLYLAKGDGSLMQLRPEKGIKAKLVDIWKCDKQMQAFSVSPDSKFVVFITRLERRMILLSLPEMKCIAHDDFGSIDSSPVSIKWRKDGAYFSLNVSITSPETKVEQRIIKIYDKTGNHHSSTALDTPDYAIMDESLAWKPSGRLLATYGKINGAEAVIFFEMDGQKHSHFFVDHVNEDILDVCWNSTSDIVAARYQTCVELWTRSKNVWELKKILNNVENDHENVIFSSWDLDLSYKMHVLFDNGVYITDDVSYSYNSGFSGGSAIRVSWNGNKIYCTPFRDSEAQPPYGFSQATVPGTEHIVHVEVSSFWDGFLCITYTGHLILYRHSGTDIIPVKRFVLPRDVYIHLVGGWAWPNRSTICCTHSGSILVFSIGTLDDGDNEAVVMMKESELELKDVIRMDGENLLRIQTLQKASSTMNEASSSAESNEILAEADDNFIILVNLKTHENEKLVKFSRVFAHYGHLDMGSNAGIVVFAHCPWSGELILGLSRHDEVHELYSDCTSAVAFNGNLLVTRRGGVLDIWNGKGLLDILLEKRNVKDKDASGDCMDKSNRYLISRQIATGSEIVSCCVNNMSQVSLVLEVINKGTFEIICPLDFPN